MINDLINTIVPSVEHFRVGGYWLAFLAALLETTVGIGPFLPGSTIILILGALSARGYLDLGDLIWFAVMGAIIGDNINYSLGKRYGAEWLQKGILLIKPQHFEKVRRFMDAHGAKSVFFGRFIPSGKEVIPFIAGSVRMNKRTFMFWNILGAIGWGFQWVLVGYIFAQSLNVAELWLSRAGLFFALLLILCGIFFFIKWLIIKKGKTFFVIISSLWKSIKEAVLNNDNVVQWMQKHSQSVSFLQARLDTSTFSGLPLSILTLAFVYVLTLFGGIVEDLITADPIVAADIRIANLLVAFRTDALINVFSWITLLGKSQVILSFIAVSVVLLCLWRRYYYILPLFIAVVGSEAFTYLGKLAFHRPRPEMAVYVEHSFSFPSGHATIAVAFYGFLSYLFIRFTPSWRGKVNLFFTGILIILAIGLSRIYLGVHYLSDVWSGYLVGAIWLIIAISFSEWLKHKNMKDRFVSPIKAAYPISFGLVITAILFYVGFAINYHPSLPAVPLDKTAIVSKVIDVFANEHMKYTESVIGEKQEPVNFIFLAKDDQHLIEMLQQAGWIVAEKADISSFVKTVKALILKTPYSSAPVSPSFWNAKTQDLSFVKSIDRNMLSSAHRVKIWRTKSISKDGNHIYVGMVNANNGLKWGVIPKLSPNIDAERELLYQDLHLSGKKNYQKKQLVKPQIGTNITGDQFFTDGFAYVISLE